jgi:hypothetical protein
VNRGAKAFLLADFTNRTTQSRTPLSGMNSSQVTTLVRIQGPCQHPETQKAL